MCALTICVVGHVSVSGCSESCPTSCIAAALADIKEAAAASEAGPSVVEIGSVTIVGVLPSFLLNQTVPTPLSITVMASVPTTNADAVAAASVLAAGLAAVSFVCPGTITSGCHSQMLAAAPDGTINHWPVSPSKSLNGISCLEC